MMPVLGVIPARLGSTRLAQKPLQLLHGEPLVVRVLDRVRQLDVVDEVVVATDAPEVSAVVKRSGGRVIMTSPLHESGTERVAEVAARPEFADFDLVLNVQGDEPFVSGAALRGALTRVTSGDDIGTAAAPLDPADADDPSRVKVVVGGSGRALYFSRARIPYDVALERTADRSGREAGAARGGAWWQHVGIYAYSRDALARWMALPPSDLERRERLEQLRPLYYGMSIGVATLAEQAAPGIDTPGDLARAHALWEAYAMGEGVQ